MRFCTFIFSMSCSIASVTSYLSGIEAKNLQNGDAILLKFLTLKWNISRTIWRIEVGDGSFFCIFHAFSFELNFFFDRRFPLIPPFSFFNTSCSFFNTLIPYSFFNTWCPKTSAQLRKNRCLTLKLVRL